MNGKKLKFPGFAAIAALFAVVLTGAPRAGWCLGGSIGDVIQNTVESSADIPGLLSGLSYLFGLVLGAWGIIKVKEHVDNPMQVPLSDSMKRFLAGGALFALPIVMEAAYNTVAVDINSLDETGFNGQTTGNGLDAMVVMLMADIWEPVQFLIGGFAYLAGIVFIIIGIMRLLKSAQEGPRGPGGIGTIMTFITAGLLFSADRMMGAWTTSMFGTPDVQTYAQLAFQTGMQDNEVQHVQAVISGVEAFIMVLGWVSFIRGFFIIRGVAEGDQQASLMAGITHLFGGALAVNLGPVVNAVQTTLGLNAYGVNFT